jgi:hypothetical protein
VKSAVVFSMLLGIATTCVAADTPLGRLFFTPEQRLLLDRQRQYAGASESAIRLDGRVKGSKRQPTVWINGRIEADERLSHGMGLRVGETMDPVTRRKTDLVPDGSITRLPRH